jgi:hypothetical protein
MKKLIAGFLCFLTMASVDGVAGENRRVRIINRSSTAMHYFYASNVDRTTWERDILGSRTVVMPNHYVDVNIDDGSGHCRYDLRVVMSDQREAVRRDFNVCTQSSWTITD